MAVDTIIMCVIASLYFLSELNRKDDLGGRDRAECILPSFYLRLEGLALIIAQPTYVRPRLRRTRNKLLVCQTKGGKKKAPTIQRNIQSTYNQR